MFATNTKLDTLIDKIEKTKSNAKETQTILKTIKN
jgi:hypothetical protein